MSKFGKVSELHICKNIYSVSVLHDMPGIIRLYKSMYIISGATQLPRIGISPKPDLHVEHHLNKHSNCWNSAAWIKPA